MNWTEIRLEEIADFRNGVNFTNDSFGKGIKVINVADFKDRMYPEYESLGELDGEAKWHKDCFLKENDIVFVRSNGNKNLIGRSLFIKNLPTNIKVTYSAFSIRLRFKTIEDICPEFYLYLFKSPIFRSILSQYGNGANISNLNQDILNNMYIPKPPLPIQQKIASILSSYDELIENNKQRIKLLEEMAEVIYKEWFVRLRFPGYENSEIVDGLPKGWERKPIDNFVNIISGYAFKTESFDSEGIYKLVTIKNVQDGFFVTQTTDYIYELPKNLKEDCKLKDKDIILSLTGNIGRICMVYGDNYVLNQRVAKLKPIQENYFEFVYLMFRSNFLRATLENLSNGAAQQNLSPIEMGKLEFLFPSTEVINKFSELTKSFFDEIITLNKKNHLLQETRDLLLPRLISGKLSVEHLLDENENLLMVAEPRETY